MTRFNAAKLTAGLIFSTVFLAACGGGSDDGGTGDSADVPLSSAPALVQQYAGLFNAARAQSRQCGTVSAPAVAPLTDWNSKLQQAAQKHADDMAKNNFLGHTGSDGSSIDSRAKAFGYTGVTVSENAAGGRGSPQQIMNAWMQSQGHCLGIMAEMARSVALAQSGKYTVMLYGD